MGKSAVEGLGKFRQHMHGLEGSYVLIGGIACDVLLSEADLPFRATHDFDTVLIADTQLPATARAIWSLVKAGGYRCGWGSNEHSCFYRFTEPAVSGYPRMIEVFSRRPDFLHDAEGLEIAPLHVDDEVSSLSAIVLNDAYYSFLKSGTTTVDGLSILDELHIIPFKAKAYLDLKIRKEHGEQIDSRKIKKHKRDTLRLTQLLSGNEKIELPEPIAADMHAFLMDCKAEPVNLKQIGVSAMGMDDIVKILQSVYGHTG